MANVTESLNQFCCEPNIKEKSLQLIKKINNKSKFKNTNASVFNLELNDKKLFDHKRVFIYSDKENCLNIEKLENVLKKLKATVIHSFDDKVNYVIASSSALKKEFDVDKTKKKDAGSRNSSASEMSLKANKKPAVSLQGQRIRAYLQKQKNNDISKDNSNLQQESTSEFLQRVRGLGITIVSLNDVWRWINKHFGSLIDDISHISKTKSLSIYSLAKTLKEPALKIIDLNQKYRPEFRQNCFVFSEMWDETRTVTQGDSNRKSAENSAALNASINNNNNNNNSINPRKSDKVSPKSIKSVGPGKINRRKPKSSEGYCEICDMKYMDLKEHLESMKHQTLASYAYSDLDSFLKGFIDLDSFFQIRIKKQKAIERIASRKMIKQLSSNDFKKENIFDAESIHGNVLSDIKEISIVEEKINEVNQEVLLHVSREKMDVSNCENSVISEEINNNNISRTKSRKRRPSLSLKKVNKSETVEIIEGQIDIEKAQEVSVGSIWEYHVELSVAQIAWHCFFIPQIISVKEEESIIFDEIDIIPPVIDNQAVCFRLPLNDALFCDSALTSQPVLYSSITVIDFLSCPNILSVYASNFATLETINHSYQTPQVTVPIPRQASLSTDFFTYQNPCQHASVDIYRLKIDLLDFQSDVCIDLHETQLTTTEINSFLIDSDEESFIDSNAESSLELPSIIVNYDGKIDSTPDSYANSRSPLHPATSSYKYHAFSPFILRSIDKSSEENGFSPKFECSPVFNVERLSSVSSPITKAASSSSEFLSPKLPKSRKRNLKNRLKSTDTFTEEDFIIDLKELIDPNRYSENFFNVLSNKNLKSKSKWIFSVDSIVENQFENRYDVNLQKKFLNEVTNDCSTFPIDQTKFSSDHSPDLPSSDTGNSTTFHGKLSSNVSKTTPRLAKKSVENQKPIDSRPVIRPFRRAKYIARESISISSRYLFE